MQRALYRLGRWLTSRYQPSVTLSAGSVTPASIAANAVTAARLRSAGWAIDGNGNAQFRDTKFRGHRDG